MADHSELVSEINSVEKMGTLERLRHAKKRRMHQLKKFNQYEKHLDKASKRRKGGATAAQKAGSGSSKVHFVGDVMLLEAAARNDLDEVQELLKSGVGANAMNEDGLTALHQCCIDDLEGMMKLLVENGANVNACDSELWTSLHAAATCGHVHLCSYLIEHGAELLAVNADGNMPYDLCEDETTLDFIESQMAARGVTQEMIDETRLATETLMLKDTKELVDSNGDLEFRGHDGETLLHIAAANGYHKVAEFLLAQHVALDAEDNDSWQPIHAAACWGQLSMVELLVEHGADLDAQTRIGETPYDICEDHEMKQRITELRNEIASHRATKSHELTRRRSQNTRSSLNSNAGANVHYNSNASLAVEKSAVSASIRRTSMREKSAMHWKEAQDEAKRMRESAESVATKDEDDEEDDNKLRVAPLATPENVEVSITRDSALLNSPSHSTAKTRMQKVKDMSPAAQPWSNGNDDTTYVSVQERRRNIENLASLELPIAKLSDAKPAPTSPSGDNLVRQKAVAYQTPNQTVNKTQTPAAPSESTTVTKSSKPTETTPLTECRISGQTPAIVEQKPHVGTLADLKKQRSQRLQEQLRGHDVLPPLSDNGSLGNGKSEANGSVHTSVSSGSAIDGMTAAGGGDTAGEPIRKYSAANSEMVGDDLTRNREPEECCVLL